MTVESTGDEAKVPVFFERAVVGAIRFCGQSLGMFRFLLSRPSTLPKMIVAGDGGLAPPLSFLTLGVFVAGIVQRLSYIAAPGEPGMAKHFSVEFHRVYSEISLWEVSLRAFPCVALVVFVAVAVARLAGNGERFDRNPIVSTTCYAAGLYAITVNSVYFTIIMVNALYSAEDDTLIGYSQRQHLIMAAVVWTALYGAIAIAVAIRIAGERRFAMYRLVHFPAGIVTTVGLLGITYLTVEISFDLKSADQQQQQRWLQSYDPGLRVSLIDRHSIAASLGGRATQSVTLALANTSQETIVVPRHRLIQTADKQRSLPVLSSSVDHCQGKALVIEPQQTRAIELEIDMTSLRGKSISGETSQSLLLTYHQGQPGSGFSGREHRLAVPIPAMAVVGQGLGLPHGTLIGREPSAAFHRQVK